MRTDAVALMGNEYFGRMIAEYLSSRGWATTYVADSRESLKYSTVYFIGGAWGTTGWKKLVTIHRFMGHRLFMHWIGTDALNVLGEAQAGNLDGYGLQWVTHFVEVPWIGEELAQAGLTSEVFPLVSTRMAVDRPPAPLPDRFRFFTYLPRERPDFYGRDQLFAAVEKREQMELVVVGSDAVDHPRVPPRTNFRGWLPDLTSVISDSIGYIRLAEHDGLSFTVTETLAAGRHVLWNHRFPGCLFVGSDSELEPELDRLQSMNARGKLGVNTAGRDFFRVDLDPDLVYSRLNARIRA